MRNSIPARNDYDPSWDEPEIEITPEDEGNDPDTCLCDSAFEVCAHHVAWGIDLFYECLSCGARWHFWEKSDLETEKYNFAEALVAQRRKS